MNRGLIATRYATALYSFAADNNAEKTVYEEMCNFLKVTEEVSELRFSIENPALKIDEKKKIIYASFGNSPCKETSQFIEFLFEKDRIDFLIPTAMKFTDLYRRKNNIHHARLITATEPDAETEKKLISMIKAKTGGNVELEKDINPDIIGGFIIEVDNLQWDASIARRLKEMKEKYTKPYNCF